MLVQDVAAHAAHRHGDRVALEDGHGTTRSFSDLWERSRRLAGGLQSLGLRPGDRVLEHVTNSCTLVETDLALALAGLVRVPLNPRLGPREWAGIARDSGARALVLGGAGGQDHPGHHVDVDVVVRADDADAAADGVRSEIEQLIDSDQPFTEHRASPDDLVGITYSSGTTGAPKGSRRSHRMRVASARAMRDHVVGDPGPDALYLHAGPAIHTSGLFVLPMLELGVRQLLLHHPAPADVVTTVRRRGVTHLALVPTVVAALTNVPEVSRADFESVRMLAYAGAPMPFEQLRRAHATLTPRLVQYYGLVEAMPPLSVLSVEDHARAVDEGDAVGRSAGRVLPHVELRIDDRDGGLEVRGDIVTTGYWNAEHREDLGTSVRDGWLSTGDIGRIEQGYLRLTDRRNDMIISGGYNIYPSEVEEAVSATPGVSACAVVGVPDDLWGQRVVVAVTMSTPVGEEEARARVDVACRELARHKRPKEVLLLTDLPVGATGKVDRRAVAGLAAHALSGS